MYVRNYVRMCKSKDPLGIEHTQILAQLASCPQTQIVSVYESMFEKNDRIRRGTECGKKKYVDEKKTENNTR